MGKVVLTITPLEWLVVMQIIFDRNTGLKTSKTKATTSRNAVHRHFLVLMQICGAKQLLINYIFIFYILRRNEEGNK